MNIQNYWGFYCKSSHKKKVAIIQIVASTCNSVAVWVPVLNEIVGSFTCCGEDVKSFFRNKLCQHCDSFLTMNIYVQLKICSLVKIKYLVLLLFLVFSLCCL